MNKTLYLLRHSYTEKTDDKPDIDRSLTMKGLNKVRVLGRTLIDETVDFDAIVSSPSLRTAETAIHLVEEMGMNEQLIRYNDTIYGASVRELLEVVTQMDSGQRRVLLIGHNPSITFFSEYLTGSSIGNMQPCGLATIRFEHTEWTEVARGSGVLVSYDHPDR